MSKTSGHPTKTDGRYVPVSLIIEGMIADGTEELPVSDYPVAGGYPGIEEIKAAGYNFVALKGDLRGDYTEARGIAVDHAVGGGGKLNAVLPVEHNIVNGVGEFFAADSVEHDIAHGYLSLEGFGSAFGIDDAGKPVKVACIIEAVAGGGVALAGGNCRRSEGGIPVAGRIEALDELPEGRHQYAVQEKAAVFGVETSVICINIRRTNGNIHKKVFGLNGGCLSGSLPFDTAFGAYSHAELSDRNICGPLHHFYR